MIITLVAIYVYYETHSIEVTKHTVESKDLPKELHGFTILHITDLHSKSFGKHNHHLLSLIKSMDFQCIAITGDLLGDRFYLYKNNFSTSLHLMSELKGMAPVFYVPGNHEQCIEYETFKQELLKIGIHVLSNSNEPVYSNGATMYICGVEKSITTPYDVEKAMEGIALGSITILLSHEPSILHKASEYAVTMILAGHTHGGQIRLPFIKSIFQKHNHYKRYASGWFTDQKTCMYVCRGLGNSGLPFRFRCKPEIALLTLRNPQLYDLKK